MNYYSPFYSYAPYITAPTNKGIISGILGGVRGINWSGLLSNVQKTLGIVNQAIPMVKQVSPIVNNAKTMFKIMNEFKKVDTPPKVNNNVNVQNVDANEETIEQSQILENSNNQPTFFI